MKWRWKEHKIAYSFLILLLIVNGFNIMEAFLDQSNDLWVQKINYSIQDAKYQYQILLRSKGSFSEEAFLYTVDQAGNQRRNTWDLTQQKNQVQLTSSHPLEYVALQVPEIVPEINIRNNQQFISPWSPKIKLLESYSTPQYEYLQAPDDKIWLVNSIRPSKQFPLGIYLTILSPEGEILVDQQLISPPGIACSEPTLRTLGSDVQIFWIAQKVQGDTLQNGLFSFDVKGEVQEVSATELVIANGSFIRPILAADQTTPSQLYALWETESAVGFTLYGLSTTDAGLHPVEEYTFADTVSLGGSVQQTLLLTDPEQNHLLYWMVKKHNVSDLYFAKFSNEGRLHLPAKKIGTIPSRQKAFPLEGTYLTGQVALFYTESYGGISWYTQTAYSVYDLEGNVIQENQMLSPPDAVQITVAANNQGQLNLIWADKTRTNNRSNYDIYYQQLDSKLQVQIPVQAIFTSEADLLDPKIRQLQADRYLTWRQYHDDKYILYMRSTKPEFAAIQQQARERWYSKFLTGVQYTLGVIQKEGKGFLNLAFFNFFPFLALIGVVLFIFSIFVSNNLLNWLVVYLIFLKLEFMNLRFFQQFDLFTNLTVQQSDRIITLTFVVLVSIFVLTQRKKSEPNMGKSALMLLGWVMVTGVSFAFFNQL